MRSETIVVQPEIVQIGKEDTQLIKISNRTSEYLDNFFFCLYNTEKFDFSPDSFNLAPNEQKIITLTLKLRSVKAVSKQFAYLKSSQTNNRITILVNSFQSPQPRVATEEGLEQLNTLSSRDYRQTQAAAFNKIIEEKQNYINRLERMIKEREESAQRPKEDSRLDVSVNLMKDLEITESRNIALQKENERLIRQIQMLGQQNIVVHRKFEQYREFCDRERKQLQKTQIFSQHLSQKDQEIDRLYIRIQQLEQQGSDFLKKLAQKQSLGRQLERKVRQLQQANLRITDQMRLDNQQRIKLLQRKIEQQRQSYQNSFRTYEDKIKQLEVLASNEVSREQVYGLESQIQRLTKLVKEEKQTRREYESRVKSQIQGNQGQRIKLQLLANQYQQKNDQLIRKNKELEKSIQQLRVENKDLIKRSKGEEVSERESSFMQIALDSTKNENELLKKNYSDLEKVYHRFQQSSKQRTNDLQSQLANKQRQMDDVREEVQSLKRQNQSLQENYHSQLMKLRKENIELLEKVSVGKKGELEAIKEVLNKKEAELIEYRINEKTHQDKIEQLKRQNKSLISKVNKYKKETKIELKNINHTTVEQLRRVHQEKKQLAKKVQELEETLDSKIEPIRKQNLTTGDFSRGNANPETRKFGIKDQRKELEQSRANSNIQSQINAPQSVYQQLGQLRELDNYIRSQQQRLSRLLSLNTQFSGSQNGRSIFRAIKFFKEIQNKVKQIREQSENAHEAAKELEFMRGRLTELEALKKQNNSSLNLKDRSFANGQLMEFIRIQMKNQYKKLHETIKLNQQKHNLLKRKIYQEYRSRIISHFQKKDKTTVLQVQATLQRFIQGLSNLSHKQAVLAKQIKLKQVARKQAAQLREKVKQLSMMIEAKKGYCSREPIRIWVPENQQDWQQNMKLEAQLLSHDAQIHRLKQQLSLTKQALNAAKQEIQKSIIQHEEEQDQITRLKRQVVEIESCCQRQVEKLTKQKQQLIRKGTTTTKRQKEGSKDKQGQQKKDKEISDLKKELERKKDIIREKEKKIIEYTEYSQRSESKVGDLSAKRQISQENRHRLSELSQSNKELRRQNKQFLDRVKQLQDELYKKSTYIKSLKNNDEHRIRTQKKQEVEIEKLQKQIRDLKEDIRKWKEQVDKIKKKKDREVGALEDQLKSVKNQAKINQKSLQSIIRALLDTLRKIYSALDMNLRKRGHRIQASPDFQYLMSNPGDVDALKVYQDFEQPLNLLQNQ